MAPLPIINSSSTADATDYYIDMAPLPMNNNEPARDRLRTPRQALAPLALHAIADRSLASADPKPITQP